jgi:protein tyrosine phosphatase (PTP) superfamily phosphohydrolase (DUF442 family)
MMKFAILLSFGFLLYQVFAGTWNPLALSKYNVFAKTPTEEIQIGGRLIERHIGYLAEAGYKSILSIVEFSSNDTFFNGVEGNFPSSAYEMQLAESYGLSAKYVVSSLTVDSAKSISQIISDLPKPLFVHCHVSDFNIWIVFTINKVYIIFRWDSLLAYLQNYICI